MNTPRAVQEILRLWMRFSDANRFEDATRSPLAAQERKLLHLLQRNRDTVYGREHGFAAIKSIADFQARVPANTYETLSPYIERVTEGEPNVLTAETPLMFATTSGTTGRAKFIPVTPSYLAEYSHAIHVHTYRLASDYPAVFGGKTLVSSSSDTEGATPGGLPYGAISGYLSRTQPSFVRGFYVLPYEVCKIKHVDTKYYVTLRHAVAADVRVIVTPNPSSLLLLAEKLTRYAGELIESLRTGSLDPWMIEGEVPPGAIAGLRPDRRRADELAALLRSTGRLRPADVWPNLAVLSCWKGGTMPLYLRRLPEHFGALPVRDLGYMASEGRGGTPLTTSGAGGVLCASSHFFEFVPVDDKDSRSARFLTCDRLEPNREYFVYFTTSSGLYRYDINDVIRVVDFYHATPVIQFVRKGQGMTSITGEKLTESQMTAALMDVVEAHGFDVQHFTARVEWGAPPCYAFYAEVGEGMPPADRQRFLHAMDRALCNQNIEYEAKRDSERLGPPLLRCVAPGSYNALRQQRVSQGAPEAQVKIPQLSPDMNFGQEMHVLDEIRLTKEASA